MAIKTLNLKEGLPGVEQARTRLHLEIGIAQSRGLRLLKLIQGHGSKAVGGDLRIALQSTLRSMTKAGEIHDCISGENWRTSDERSWQLLKRMPELKTDPDLGKGNRGITLVLL